MILRLIVTSCVMFILAAQTGCPSIGGCRYRAETERRGEVTILAVEKTLVNGTGEMMKVSVDGFFRHDFYLTPECFHECISSKGFDAGSTMTGIISPGGPCPPMYRLGDCRLY